MIPTDRPPGGAESDEDGVPIELDEQMVEGEAAPAPGEPGPAAAPAPAPEQASATEGPAEPAAAPAEPAAAPAEPAAAAPSPTAGAAPAEEETAEEVAPEDLIEDEGGDEDRAFEEASTSVSPPPLANAQAQAAAPGSRVESEDEDVFASAPAPGPPPTPPPTPTEAPDGGEAALAAARHAAATADPEVALAVYGREMEAETRPARLALLQHETGELHEYHRRDEAPAAKAYAKALQNDPTYRPNLWAIRRVFYRRALWPNLLKLIGAEIKYAAQKPEEKAALFLEKGHVYEDRQGDLAGAREAYEAAIAADPGCLPALVALERLFARESDQAGERRVLELLAKATSDPARRSALYGELAALEDKPEAKLAALSEAFETGADREHVLEATARVAERAGRTDELLDALGRRAELLADSRPSEAAALERQRALVFEGERRDPERAAELYDRALSLAPSDRVLLFEATRAAEAAGHWERVATLIERRLADADAAERPALAFARAQALERAGKKSEAAEALAELGLSDPDHLPLHAFLERRALARGDAAQLVDLWVGEAERAAAGAYGLAADVDWAAATYVAAGVLSDRRLQESDRAVQLYRKGLALVEGYRPAIDALEALLDRTGRTEELAGLLEAQRARFGGAPEAEISAADRERMDVLDESLARLHRGLLPDAERAIAALGRLAARHPGDVRIRRRLAFAHAEAGRWAEVASELGALAERAHGEERLTLKLECADLLAERVGDPARAAVLYAEVLEMHPGHPVASAALETVLRREGRLPELLALLRDEVAGAPERATTALYKIAEVYERELSRPAEAAQTYREILEREPRDPAALGALSRLLVRQGEPRELVAALGEEVELAPPGRSRAEVLVRLGEACEDRLGDEERAAEAYARAIAEDPEVLEAHLGLVRSRARRREPEGLADAYAQLAAACGPDRAACGLYAGEAAWLRGEKPDGETGLALVGRYLAAARTGEPVAAEASALAEQLADPALASALGLRAALAELGMGGDARPAIARALAWQPDAAAPGWLSAQVANGDPRARADAFERAGALAPHEIRADLLIERAVALEEAGRPREAAQALGEVLGARPRSIPALAALVRLCRAAGDREGLWRALAHLGAAVGSAPHAAALFKEAAVLVDQELGRPGDAAPLFRQVLERRPDDDDTYDRLHEILAGAADTQALEELVSHRLATTEEPGARIPLHAERAELRLGPLADARGAARDLQALLELDPEHLESLRMLGEIYATEGHAPQAVHFFERFLTGADEVPVLRHAIHLRTAELCESPLRDLRRAGQHLRYAADLLPTDPAAHQRLAALYVRARDYPHAIDALRKLGETSGDPRVQARCELQAGQIYRDHVRDLGAARRAFERARDLDPLSLESLGELLVLYGKQGAEAPKKVALHKALTAFRGALAENPLQPELLQGLARVGEWLGSGEARYQGAELGVFLNAATPADEEFFASRRTGRPAEPARALSPEARERLAAPGVAGVWLDAWTIMAEAMQELVGPTPASFGVGRGDRISGDRPPNAWAFICRIAQALGVVLPEIYVSPTNADLCVPAGVAPGVLVLGQALQGTPPPRARFRLGRALAYLGTRTAPLFSLGEDEARLLLAAAAHLGGVSPPRALAGPALDERTHRIERVLGRKERRQLAGLAPRLTEAGDPRGFLSALAATAARTGLLLAGDLAAALEEALTNLPPAGTRRFQTTDDLIETLEGQAEGMQILRLALSDDLLVLRRELGWM